MYVDLEGTNVLQLEFTTFVDLEISPAEKMVGYLIFAVYAH